MARKTVTSTEVKQRWESKAYVKYNVRLRRDSDQELIDFVEKRKAELLKEDPTKSTSSIFRDALEMYFNAA